MKQYVTFDEIENVLSSLDMLAAIAPLAKRRITLWKWIIVGAQDALQGAIVCAIADSTNTNILREDSAKKMSLKPGRPPGWDQPNIAGYFETLWGNTIATFENKEEAHRLCRIDDVMFAVASDWKGGAPNAQTIVPLMLYFRSHSAFRGAAALGLGGAHVEGYANLRQCLEFSGYAALVHDEPALANIWWDRDQDDESEKKVRRTFTLGAVRAAIEKSDAKLASIYVDLYDRVIQFGGHPNEKSVSANLKLDFKKAETVLLQIYLQGDGIQLDHWVRTANQIGICILKVFKLVHTKRFDDLQITPRIDELAKKL